MAFTTSIVCISTAAIGYFATPVVLATVGFTALGPAGYAASIMTSKTAAGSLFALAQSAGMGGASLAGFKVIGATVGTITSYAISYIF